MKKKFFILVLTLLLIVICFSACAAPLQLADTEKIKITGLDKPVEMTVDDIKALKPFSGRVEGANSEGEPVNYDIKGGYLKELLEKMGFKQTDFSSIRIVSTDGYSINVPKSILDTRDIILAYQMDGKSLDKENAPIRVFIPNERAMYWARMVSEIQMEKTGQKTATTGIVIMDSVYKEADYEDYELIGQNYKSINTQKIIKSYPGSGGDIVLMTAADGLLKNETLQNFQKGAINMTGENTPEFISSVLPSGMFVKNLMLFTYGGNAFVFISKLIEKENDLNMQTLLKSCDMQEASDYTLTFKDGKTKDIKADDLSTWKIAYDSAKGMCVYMNENEKSWDLTLVNVKQ